MPFFANGNVYLTIDEVIRKVRQYQREQNDYYGVSEDDFQVAIIELIHLQEGTAGSMKWKDRNVLLKIPLKNLIEPILDYYDVWYKDTDVYWSTNKQMNQNVPTLRNVRMRLFFQKSYHFDPERILRFLDQSGWKNTILQQYLCNGQRENGTNGCVRFPTNEDILKNIDNNTEEKGREYGDPSILFFIVIFDHCSSPLPFH